MVDVRENINGTDTVTGTARVLRQFTGDHHTLDFTDLPDRSGYQIATYRNADLGAPAANGIRPVLATARPVSILIYRNPDGQETLTQGRLDIIEKLRHPQTNEWVVTTIRQVFPVGGDTWTRDFHAGDLQQAPDLAPYRSVVFNRTRHDNGTETFLATVSDRGNNGTMVVTSRISRTYAYYKLGDPAVLSETIDPGSPGALTTDWTYFTDAANPFSFNKPATMRRSDGAWANYTYQGSEVTGITITKTTTGIGDAPAPAIGTEPNPAVCRVITEIEARLQTGTFGREETVGGVLVSKSWGERHVDPAGFLVETRHRETGAGRLTTIRTGHPADARATGAERGRLKSIQHPDGTITLYHWAHEGENLVETTEHGSGTLSGVTSGTRTRTVKSPHEETIAETVTDIASGVQLSSRVAVAMDHHQLPTKWVYDNDPSDYSETQRGCCGIESERARDGTVTRYLRDALKRPVLVTTTTGARVVTRTYNHTASAAPETSGLPETTVTTTATGVGGAIVQTTITDLLGRTVSETAPGPMGTAETSTYAYSADGLVTTQTNPDLGQIVTTSHLDGRTKSVTGPGPGEMTGSATIERHYLYGTHTENGGGELTTEITANGTGGSTTTYSDLAGRTFKFTKTAPHNQTAVTTTTYNALGQVETVASSGQPTVKYLYNAEGERIATWTDRNGDGQFNDATAPGLPDVKDSCTTTQSDYLPAASAPAGLGDCQRTISTVRTEANEDKVVSTTWQSVDGLRSRQETLGVAGASTATRTRPMDGASSSTQTNPDGTSSVTETIILANGHTQTTSIFKDTSSVILQTSSLVSDALGRTTQTTNGRGHVTSHAYYMHGGQTASITQVNAAPGGGNLVTGYTYTLSPGSGRITTTTLPDGTMQYQESNQLGQTTRQWGSQTNPVKFTYDAAGRMATHTTYRAPVVPGNQQAIPSAGDATTWVHDPSGVLLEKVHADGNKTTYTYDIAGRLATRTWARGVVTVYSYTAGQLAGVEYFGSVAGWENYRNLRALWQTMVADSANHTAQEIADAEAAMLAARAAAVDGTTPDVTATYNRLGQLLTASQSGAATAPDADFAFGYHPDSLRFTSETIAIDPDGNGPLPSLTRTIDRSRDQLQRPSGYQLKTENLTLETSIGYGYDVSGRLATLSAQGLPNLPGKSHAFEYSYEPGSSLLDKVTGPVHEVDNTYETHRNVLSEKKNTRTVGTPGELSVIGYTVNRLGQREQRNLSGLIRAEFYGGQAEDLYPTDWGYDALGQVTSEDKPSTAADRGYSYDQIGNRLTSTADSATTTYTSNSLNQYTSILPLPVGEGGGEGSSVQPAYDQDGNMTTGLLNGSTAGQFEYDGANQLIRTQTTATSDPTRYAYDAFGRRFAKVTYPNGGGAATPATVFLYDGWNLIAEYKLDAGAWSLDRTYTWGIDLSGSTQGAGGVGGLLSVTKHEAQSTSVFYPIYDGNGNIEAYLDSNGAPAAIYQYDAFGNLLSGGGKGAAIEQAKFSHRFSTKYQDAETGLLYYGYRYYHAPLGRWINRDPIQEKGGWNLYVFVRNSLPGKLDKLGLDVTVPYSPFGPSGPLVPGSGCVITYADPSPTPPNLLENCVWLQPDDGDYQEWLEYLDQNGNKVIQQAKSTAIGLINLKVDCTTKPTKAQGVASFSFGIGDVGALYEVGAAVPDTIEINWDANECCWNWNSELIVSNTFGATGRNIVEDFFKYWDSMCLLPAFPAKNVKLGSLKITGAGCCAKPPHKH